MKIQNMHYDFKFKIDKVDSNLYRHFFTPQIDWLLNEAISIFVNNIINPKSNYYNFIFKVQRTIDDIRTLLSSYKCEVLKYKDKNNNDIYNNNDLVMPSDYLHFLSGMVNVKLTRNDDDRYLDIYMYDSTSGNTYNSYNKSSLGWNMVMVEFIKRYYKDIDSSGVEFSNNAFVMSLKNDFDTNLVQDSFKSANINYIKKPVRVSLAKQNNYDLPSGEVINEDVDCDLPDIVHREIVDIAVLLATIQIDGSYTSKASKLKFNNS